MKKILFTALTAVSIFTSAFAKNEHVVSTKVITAFEKEFYKATDVNWTAGPTFTQASFTLDGKKMNAFYDVFNEMIGTSHQASFEGLSKNAQQKITKKYAGYTITDVIAFQCDGDDDCYYVSAQNGLQNLILKVRNDMVVVFKKSKMK